MLPSRACLLSLTYVCIIYFLYIPVALGGVPYTVQRTVNITSPMPYTVCNYYTLSYRIWCSGKASTHISTQADCLTYPECQPDLLYSSMRCGPSVTCTVPWTGAAENENRLCLVVSIYNGSNINSIIKCDISITGTTTPYSPEPTSWPTWKLVLVICSIVFGVLLLLSLGTWAGYHGIIACCRSCRCGDYANAKVLPDDVPPPFAIPAVPRSMYNAKVGVDMWHFASNMPVQWSPIHAAPTFYHLPPLVDPPQFPHYTDADGLQNQNQAMANALPDTAQNSNVHQSSTRDINKQGLDTMQQQEKRSSFAEEEDQDHEQESLTKRQVPKLAQAEPGNGHGMMVMASEQGMEEPDDDLAQEMAALSLPLKEKPGQTGAVMASRLDPLSVSNFDRKPTSLAPLKPLSTASGLDGLSVVPGKPGKLAPLGKSMLEDDLSQEAQALGIE